MASKKNLGGRWEIIKSLTEGGQAHIYEVKDIKGEHKDIMILKRLKNMKRLDRFEKEIKVVERLDHPGIPPIIDYSLKKPAFFVTLKYDAPTIDKLSKLDILRILDIFKKVCQVINYAHVNGVVHRDIKPSNIIVCENDEPIVLDFGLCYSMQDEQRLTATMEQVGSRFYMAPELESGKADQITPLVDSYSLGKVLYFMITGRNIARENFMKENNLVKVTGDEQLGYITKRVLRKTICENPNDRADVDELIPIIERITKLIKKNFYPGTEGSLCRFCGEGYYKENCVINLPGIYSNKPDKTVNYKTIVCNNCGNVAWFLPNPL